ncbi:hypothetical protein QQP08_007999 [Theobroma cacao]|nr:hypothetical protein QQP08_007999 [Theobroma cacao]
MCSQRALKPSKALEGVHGVQVVSHSPFALEEINQHGDFQHTHDKSFITANQPLLIHLVHILLLPVTRHNILLTHVFQSMAAETSLFKACKMLYARGPESSRDSCQCVNITSFYCSWDPGPKCLSRALRNENPKLLMAASALLLPVQPLMVSAVHTGMMEVAFAKRALKDPELRMAHNVHKMSSLLGGVLFIADDVFPSTPFLHAAWHLAAAVGVGTCTKLLE